MNVRVIFLFIGLVFIQQSIGYAATVDTVLTRSASMQKDIKAVIVKPASYDRSPQQRFPVVYLLHGYGGNFSSWIKEAEQIKEEADRYNMLLVCPDGGFGSWYWDSPVDPAYRYETYVSKELVNWVDQQYKTIASPLGRAITGLSMGGHGALYLALQHKDVFGAAGSMSGGVDIRPFPKKWDMEKRLGKYADHKNTWEEHTVINLLHLAEPGKPAILVDCGTEDFFYEVNERLHQELLYRKIQHDYTTRPGAHNWDYWSVAVRYQFLFMHQFFQKKQP
ncbi:alpha/beta hydrolase family protein [Flavihumibacter sp. CACIAM 22H1]|uniref:alpha/beta hydrolase n=1 Tax=Flavihumibacter sp. CACIAM 22H1 TaxID=1812911 RepID=UPI0007A8A6B6|nr:alpha/beta hydrolase family protein [Flavihumibacter sp. CACIAM 22H1]KYP14313.1 MAG: XynC protein [Flavihumibacter sp. CACIAM 22H1]